MRVTIETTVDEETTEMFLGLYRAAFDPLAPLAAARQSLTDDEFREEMSEPSVVKFVGWNRREQPVAMMLVATDLAVVPWISEAFWAARYPEQHGRGAIHYYAALLVSPEVKGGPWAAKLLGEATSFTAGIHGIAAFDCCRFNVTDVGLPDLIADVGHRLCHLEPQEVDTQHYFAYVTHGLKETVIDLRETGDRSDEVSGPASEQVGSRR